MLKIIRTSPPPLFYKKMILIPLQFEIFFYTALKNALRLANFVFKTRTGVSNVPSEKKNRSHLVNTIYIVAQPILRSEI